MSSDRRASSPGVLVLAAAPAEVAAVARGLGGEAPVRDWEPVRMGDGWWLARTGVGKVNAGVCAAVCCERGLDGATVLNLGVCGALPGDSGIPANGSVVIASASLYGDEGVRAPSGFVDMASLGFPPWPGEACGCSAVTADDSLVRWADGSLRGILRGRLRVGPIATVSTCSGTDAASREIAARTGAVAEGMEGAAIGHALLRLRGPGGFLEVRVVSNPTGDREKQSWDLDGALGTLSEVSAALRGSAPAARA